MTVSPFASPFPSSPPPATSGAAPRGEPARRNGNASPGPGSAPAPPSTRPQRRIAYVMSRFPKLTETFVLYEMQSLERLGATVEVYPLWRERTRRMHEDARPYLARAHFRRLLSWPVLAANLRRFGRTPRHYLGVLAQGIVANWGSPRYLLGFLATFPKAVQFAEEMQREQVDHVHAHFASHPAAVAWVIRQLTGIPYSFTAHGSDLHRDVHMLREKVRDASLVIAISSFNRERIMAEADPADGAKVRVVHCGTDLAVFRPRTMPRDPERPVQLVCVGTLHEVKGQRHLIAACARLRQQGLPFHLHLIGSGPDESLLRAAVERHGLADHVTFHGSRTRAEVASLLPEMDLAVTPSVPTSDGRKEGIPVALMEAMACGLPAVASRLTGIPELVADRITGRLVPPGDPASLADAIQELAQQPALRDRWGQAARQVIERHFDLRRNAEQLLAAIHEVHAAMGEEQAKSEGGATRCTS